eukprot:9503849-Pyramimonas_sp.AAC.1
MVAQEGRPQQKRVTGSGPATEVSQRKWACNIRVALQPKQVNGTGSATNKSAPAAKVSQQKGARNISESTKVGPEQQHANFSGPAT